MQAMALMLVKLLYMPMGHWQAIMFVLRSAAVVVTMVEENSGHMSQVVPNVPVEYSPMPHGEQSLLEVRPAVLPTVPAGQLSPTLMPASGHSMPTGHAVHELMFVRFVASPMVAGGQLLQLLMSIAGSEFDGGVGGHGEVANWPRLHIHSMGSSA